MLRFSLLGRFVMSLVRKMLNRMFHRPCSGWLNRTSPFSRVFGLDRGLAIDRRFIEKFIASRSAHVSGSVLEIGDDTYTYKFGSGLRRTVIFAGQLESNRSECFPGDLTRPESYSNLGLFDCVIATNVINFIFDFDAAVRGLSQLVKPQSGVVLATVAGLSQISRFDYDRWGDYWRFNDLSIRRVFEKYFNDVHVEAFGNAPLAAAFIMGLCQEEIPKELFAYCDPDFQVLVSVMASSPKYARQSV